MNFLGISSILVLAGLLLSCDATPGGKTEKVLLQFQKTNDALKQQIFSKKKLSPAIAEKDLTPESRYRNNSFDTDRPPSDTTDNWRLEVAGLVKYPGMYSLEQIKTLGITSENAKHVCVEGWSQNVKWGGTQLYRFLDWIGADPNAKYLYVECADKYYESYDIESARHEQTLLCYEAYNKPLTLERGAPCRIVMPTKLGYKSAKWITKIIVTDKKPGGYWEDQGYDWHAGM
jgi:DMSO/TMAO reductase YedYZ molybdopterin-dependent catalytic subunit